MGQSLKRPDWKDRLADYIRACCEKPFSWSDHSCVSFTAGAIEAMTGNDYWRKQLDDVQKFESRASVLRYMTNYGGTLVGTVDKALSEIAYKRKIPGQGDIVIAMVDNTEVVGICLGRLSVFIRPTGIVYLKPDVIAAWRLN